MYVYNRRLLVFKYAPTSRAQGRSFSCAGHGHGCIIIITLRARALVWLEDSSENGSVEANDHQSCVTAAAMSSRSESSTNIKFAPSNVRIPRPTAASRPSHARHAAPIPLQWPGHGAYRQAPPRATSGCSFRLVSTYDSHNQYLAIDRRRTQKLLCACDQTIKTLDKQILDGHRYQHCGTISNCY